MSECCVMSYIGFVVIESEYIVDYPRYPLNLSAEQTMRTSLVMYRVPQTRLSHEDKSVLDSTSNSRYRIDYYEPCLNVEKFSLDNAPMKMDPKEKVLIEALLLKKSFDDCKVSDLVYQPCENIICLFKENMPC